MVDDSCCFLDIRLGPKTSECEKNVTVVSTVTGCDVTNCATTLQGSTKHFLSFSLLSFPFSLLSYLFFLGSSLVPLFLRSFVPLFLLLVPFFGSLCFFYLFSPFLFFSFSLVFFSFTLFLFFSFVGGVGRDLSGERLCQDKAIQDDSEKHAQVFTWRFGSLRISHQRGGETDSCNVVSNVR